MKALEYISGRLPKELADTLTCLPSQISENIEEIRIRAGKPLFIYGNGCEFEVKYKNKNTISKDELSEVFRCLVQHSVYSYQDDIADGFITIPGGNRIGICGSAIIENGSVKTIENISSINIRHSKELRGISDPVTPLLFSEEGNLYSTIILSPPKCGKTTLLRDIIRNISNRGLKVGVCDERSEIAACCDGVPEFDLGLRTDVLDGCPKGKGIVMLIRSMSPDVIATDEIGKEEDIGAVETAVVSGVSLITTIHANDFHDLRKSIIGRFISDGVFERLIVLSNKPATGTIIDITDNNNISLLRESEFKW